MAATRRQAAAKAASRARILKVAHELFRERGYDEAQIRKIAEDAGLSVGAVFGHFESKAALWREAMGREAPDPLAFVRDMARHDPSPWLKAQAQQLLTDLLGRAA